ncbi:hypothetical protein GCM10020254_12650 [Streptomyces goshikiensis]
MGAQQGQGHAPGLADERGVVRTLPAAGLDGQGEVPDGVGEGGRPAAERAVAEPEVAEGHLEVGVAAFDGFEGTQVAVEGLVEEVPVVLGRLVAGLGGEGEQPAGEGGRLVKARVVRQFRQPVRQQVVEPLQQLGVGLFVVAQPQQMAVHDPPERPAGPLPGAGGPEGVREGLGGQFQVLGGALLQGQQIAQLAGPPAQFAGVRVTGREARELGHDGFTGGPPRGGVLGRILPPVRLLIRLLAGLLAGLRPGSWPGSSVLAGLPVRVPARVLGLVHWSSPSWRESRVVRKQGLVEPAPPLGGGEVDGFVGRFGEQAGRAAVGEQDQRPLAGLTFGGPEEPLRPGVGVASDPVRPVPRVRVVAGLRLDQPAVLVDGGRSCPVTSETTSTEAVSRSTDSRRPVTATRGTSRAPPAGSKGRECSTVSLTAASGVSPA